MENFTFREMHVSEKSKGKSTVRALVQNKKFISLYFD